METLSVWRLTRRTHGFLSCYIYTIVTRGWLTILYNNRELTLHKGDLYTYSPGFEITILSSSSDYSGICLLGDEHFTLSLPTVRDAIRTAYFTVVELTSPILPLKADDFRRLRELMQMMIHYQQMGLPLANDSLRMLYNLFLTDLSTVQQHSIREHRFPKRVVRQVSGGRTVVDYINQMLLMEATFLLRQTSLSITQISNQLHFAEVTTFTRFFNRMKGVNPREFRKGK